MQIKVPGLKRALVDIGLFSFVVNGLMLVMPLYLLQIYDRVLTSNRLETLTFLTIMAVAAFACLGLFEIVRTSYAARLANKVDIGNVKAAFTASLASPRASLGDIQPLRDLSTVRRVIGSKLIFVLFDAPFAPLFILALYLIHPNLFWLTAIGAIVLVGLAVASQMAVAKASRESSGRLIGSMASAEAITRSSDSVTALGMAGDTMDRWGIAYSACIEGADQVAQINSVFSGISRAIRMILQIAILGVGAWLVLNNQMTAGMIFAASIISGRGLQPIDQLISSWPQILEFRETVKRLTRAFSRVADNIKYDPIRPFDGQLRAENIVYRLPQASPNEPPIIKPTSFVVEPGKCVCVVGPNSAGKSTLIRLCAGALEAMPGFVRFDRADIRSFDPDELGKHIGYLSQRVEMLPGTIFENIARFSPDATDDAVEQAARFANVHEEINALPNRYQTVIGPTHYMPSGGNMQRLGLARALYGNPRFVFLDEPNANLDQAGNRYLVDTLKKLRDDGVTVMMVSQRDEIIPVSDRLMVLRNGSIVEYEPTEVLLKKSRPDLLKAYYELHGIRSEIASRNSQASMSASQSTAKTMERGDATRAERHLKSPFEGYGPGMRPIQTSPTKGNGS